MTAKQELLDPLLSRAIVNGASDLLVAPGVAPRIFVRGHVQPVAEAAPIDNHNLDAILDEVFGSSRWAAFSIDAARGARSYLDTGLTHEGATFRVTVQADENFRLFASFRNVTGLVTDGPTTEQVEAIRAAGPLGSGKISSLETAYTAELIELLLRKQS